jgi:hypothetical protein
MPLPEPAPEIDPERRSPPLMDTEYKCKRGLPARRDAEPGEPADEPCSAPRSTGALRGTGPLLELLPPHGGRQFGHVVLVAGSTNSYRRRPSVCSGPTRAVDAWRRMIDIRRKRHPR